jgi:hypothetical protein
MAKFKPISSVPISPFSGSGASPPVAPYSQPSALQNPTASEPASNYSPTVDVAVALQPIQAVPPPGPTSPPVPDIVTTGGGNTGVIYPNSNNDCGPGYQVLDGVCVPIATITPDRLSATGQPGPIPTSDGGPPQTNWVIVGIVVALIIGIVAFMYYRKK